MCGRFDEVSAKLATALFIAPIADPDEIARLLRATRLKQRCIGRLMPGEGAATPTSRTIHVPQRRAECQHAVVLVQIKRGNRMGRRHGAMMGIKEEEPKISSAPAATDR